MFIDVSVRPVKSWRQLCALDRRRATILLPTDAMNVVTKTFALSFLLTISSYSGG